MIVEDDRTVQENFVLFSANPDYYLKHHDKKASQLVGEENMDHMSTQAKDIHNIQLGVQVA